jgi:hypothetical protein
MSILPESRADADVAKMGRSLVNPDAPATLRQRSRYSQSAETCSGYFGMLTSMRAAHLFSRSAPAPPAETCQLIHESRQAASFYNTKEKSIPDGSWKITLYIAYEN